MFFKSRLIVQRVLKAQNAPLILMVAFTGLFVFRVVAQMLQISVTIPILPSFAIWQSGTIHYAWLLLSQFCIVFGMIWACNRTLAALEDEKTFHIPDLMRRFILFVGMVYFAVMMLRLILGQFVFTEHHWFRALLPTLFHFAIAGFIMAFALNAPAFSPLNSLIKRGARWILYPFLVSTGVLLHLHLMAAGEHLAVASFLPVVLCLYLIVLSETVMPAASEWRPDADDLRTDLTHLVLIQGLLPKLLLGVIGIIGLKIWLSSSDSLSPMSWPHDWPIAVQTLLMLLIADFLRYWLHRAAHTNAILWRFHAVHHSPKKLHALNVGRFHPLDKTVQFFLDTLPFVLIGVSEEVLALYFVIYGINGFFQHSNIDVRFGWLNYLVSGPELHRWHHSQLAAESNNNYGNNTIIWDLVFGTRLLPVGRTVGVLGLVDRHYPEQFSGQMLAPFKRSSRSAND